MMKYITFILLACISALSVAAQKEPALARSMDSVHIVDQAIRKLFSSSSDIDSIAKARNISVAEVYNVLSAEMVRIDSANMRFTDSVIKIYGYPGKSLVGENASYAAWSVIQHSNRIDEFMPLLKDAADKGELDFHFYAMTLDRQLMYKRQEQIYGTQGSMVTLKNGEKGMIIWPIKDPEGVDERRRKAGFTSTVKENAARMRIDYKVYKLSDLSEPVKKP
ncbi:DUF6624 domain-containing protein [Chitinophaga niabensis]|uniref:DUF6624 domain-containing protein n=1 Tax=Chitinophaga niabensis TaxID=536979 RepID=UPI0031B9E068